MEEYGLEINVDNSNIIIANMKEKPTDIARIKVVDSIKYLGVVVSGEKDCFKKHKAQIITKANRLANQISSIIAKSCNKMIIGKTFWKNVALPSILHGTNTIHFNKREI